MATAAPAEAGATAVLDTEADTGATAVAAASVIRV
jgi:hypothetical protein